METLWSTATATTVGMLAFGILTPFAAVDGPPASSFLDPRRPRDGDYQA